MPEAQDPTSNEVHAAAEKVRLGMDRHDPELREEGLEVIRRAERAASKQRTKIAEEAIRRGVKLDDVPGGTAIVEQAIRERRVRPGSG